MTEEVSVVRLPATRVACLSVRAESPEQEALSRLMAWGEEKGLTEGARLFGSDNCKPHPDHIYTAMLTVGPDVAGDVEVVIKDAPGGQYAMTSVTGTDEIGEGYQRLADWAAANPHEFDRDHPFFEMEAHLTPLDTPLDKIRMDLHLRLVE
jgi:DNA gyrase inhibitor GyrI